MRSIRETLLWRLFVGAAVTLLAGALLLHAGVGWLLTEQFDDVLRARLALFAAQLEQQGRDLEIGFVEQIGPEFDPGDAADYLELWYVDGTVLYRTPSLGALDLPREHGPEEAPRTWDVALPDGRAGRAIGAEIVVDVYQPGEEDPGPAHVFLVLATGRESLDRAFVALRWGTVVASLLLLGAGVLIVRATVRGGLAPLAALARHVGAIEDPLRASSFPERDLPAELVPLVRSHAQMLVRIRRAFEREQRTTANIAHELRTPLSELALLCETAERYAADPRETQQKLAEMREVCAQMSTLVATLLELARMESGTVPLEIEPIDLAQMVRDGWSAFAPVAAAKGLAFRPPAGVGPVVQADRAALSILLANLLSNAVEHAPSGDAIDCELGTRADASFLALTNGANGLAGEDLDKLAEPFWRRSPAREERAHAGLGLSLVARLSALLAIEVSYRVEDGRFRVELAFAPGAR